MAVGWFATKREAALVRISTSKSEAMALNGEMAAFILAPMEEFISQGHVHGYPAILYDGRMVWCL